MLTTNEKIYNMKTWLENQKHKSLNPLVLENINKLLKCLSKIDIETKNINKCNIHVLIEECDREAIFQLHLNTVEDIPKWTDELVSKGYDLKYKRKYIIKYTEEK